jgi:uncharacterized protein
MAAKAVARFEEDEVSLTAHPPGAAPPALHFHRQPRLGSFLLRQAVREMRAAVVTLLCLSIRVYQCLLSPLLGNCCRFEPSCSRYAQLCIERLGPLRGSWLALRRLLRCHPFCPGGHDPPPEVTS